LCLKEEIWTHVLVMEATYVMFQCQMGISVRTQGPVGWRESCVVRGILVRVMGQKDWSALVHPAVLYVLLVGSRGYLAVLMTHVVTRRILTEIVLEVNVLVIRVVVIT
jgi:hypothetical protein